MAETAYVPRLRTEYENNIKAALREQFAYKNVMELPRLDKIVLNMGVGEAVNDTKKVKSAADQLELIAGQKPVITHARKSIAGHNASQVILTVTAKEKGKDLEEGGGLVITSDVWVAPRVAALDEITQFTTKFLQAVYGDDAVASAQQMATVMAMYPSLQEMMTKLEEKTRALDGTVMTTVTKIETIKSAEAMKRSSAPPTGGLGGALARRLGAGRAPEQRSLVLTSAGETQSIDTSASDADVAIPAGFKERK